VRSPLKHRWSIAHNYLAGITAGDWWRPITAGFLHANLLHVGFNMFLLWQLGMLLEPAIKARAFAALYFLSLLTAYYILRPIRDERGVFVGPDRLTFLYAFTFLTMLVVVPLWSAVVARVPRATVIPWLNRFFALCLVGFFWLFQARIGERATAQVFFVWVSVFNFLWTSVFWGLMADVFSHEQGKRLFGFIAAGGSAGAILGPILTQGMLQLMGPAVLLLPAALLMEVTARCVKPIVRARQQPGESAAQEEGVGGGAFSGFRAVFASPFLLAIAAYTLLASSAGTWGYNLLSRLVHAAHVRSPEVASGGASSD